MAHNCKPAMYPSPKIGKKRIRDIHIKHTDEEWIRNKIDGHGGAYSYSSRYSIVIIDYIGSTGKLKVLYYNFLLLLKYLERKLEKITNP